jgi:hypothetical protein
LWIMDGVRRWRLGVPAGFCCHGHGRASMCVGLRPRGKRALQHSTRAPPSASASRRRELWNARAFLGVSNGRAETQPPGTSSTAWGRSRRRPDAANLGSMNVASHATFSRVRRQPIAGVAECGQHAAATLRGSPS